MTDSNTVDDAIADAQDNPANEADAPEVKLTKAEKAAIKKIETDAKKKAADKVKKAADKVKDAEKVKAAKVKADAKQLAITERGVKPLINAGLKAMHMVGNGNKDWTIAAFKLRELCKGTPVNFKDAMLEGWGVQKNTATKLANAGELMNDLVESDSEEVRGLLEHMPMGSINNLSVISGFSEIKMDLGIDTDVIRIDSTEKEIADFNVKFNDKGEEVVVKEVPSTPAADAEDAAKEDAGETVSESETPAQLIARLVDAASDLTPANMIKLIVQMSAGLSDKRTNDLLDAIEKAHGLVAPADGE